VHKLAVRDDTVGKARLASPRGEPSGRNGVNRAPVYLHVPPYARGRGAHKLSPKSAPFSARPRVIGMRVTVRGERRLAVEAAAYGLGYASVLCWASTCLVAIFGGAPLASPYWPDIPWLRTDTTGIVTFTLAAVCLVVAKYLRLRRLGSGWLERQLPDRAAIALAARSVAETAVILGTGVVACLSFNVVTHSYTLRVHVIHLLSWPSEGTVRVIALIICALSMALTRYLRAITGAGRADETGWSAHRDRQFQVLGDGSVRQVE
jgi:hypothetical protein